MTLFLFNKVKEMILTLLILSLGVYMIAHIAPGDPLFSIHGDAAERLSKENKIKTIREYGLDKPILIQYGYWIKNSLKGDMGYSFRYKTKVSELLKTHIPNTLCLMGISILLTLILSITIGIFTAFHEGKLLDRLIMQWNTLLYCIPGFWLSLLLILVFCTNLRVLPSSGISDIGMEEDIVNRLIHLILPIVVMVIGHLGYYSNFVRNKILEEIKEDYIMFARAKGLSKFEVMIKHPLKKITPSIITLMSISLNHLIAGGFVVEYMFAYPGVGKLIFDSAKNHDYPLLWVEL